MTEYLGHTSAAELRQNPEAMGGDAPYGSDTQPRPEVFNPPKDGTIIVLDPELLAAFNKKSCPEETPSHPIIEILPADEHFARLRINNHPTIRRFRRYNPEVNSTTQVLNFVLWRCVVIQQPFTRADIPKYLPEVSRDRIGNAISTLIARGIIEKWKPSEKSNLTIYDLPKRVQIIDHRSTEQPLVPQEGIHGESTVDSAPLPTADLTDPKVQIKMMVSYLLDMSDLEIVIEQVKDKRTIDMARRIAEAIGNVDPKKDNRLADWYRQLP